MARHLTAIKTEVPAESRIAGLGKALLWLLGWMTLSGPVAALSLGDLVVHSSPGKPLRASVPLALEGDEQLADLQISLATAEDYLQAYLKHPVFLDDMRIGLLATGRSAGRIQLFGRQSWNGEEATLLLHVNWPQGQLSRRFRLAPVRLEAEEGDEQPVRFVEVTENETLDVIAMRLSEETNRSYFHMMYSLFLANPEAFYGGNMNNLKHGARLRVPTGAELYRLKDAEVFRAIRQQYEEWLQQQNTPAEAKTEDGPAVSRLSQGQTEVLDLSGEPQVLNRQLEQLGEENDTLQQRNAELRSRLSRLEQQMKQVAEQVLDYQPIEVFELPLQQEAVKTTVDQKPAAEEKPAAAEENTPAEKRRPPGAEGLPGHVLFLVLALVLLSGILVRRFTAAQQGSAA